MHVGVCGCVILVYTFLHGRDKGQSDFEHLEEIWFKIKTF